MKEKEMHKFLQQHGSRPGTASSESDVTKAVRIFCDLMRDKNENVRKLAAAAVNVHG